MYVNCDCNGGNCKINIAQADSAFRLGVCLFTERSVCQIFALQLLNHRSMYPPQECSGILALYLGVWSMAVWPCFFVL